MRASASSKWRVVQIVNRIESSEPYFMQQLQIRLTANDEPSYPESSKPSANRLVSNAA